MQPHNNTNTFLNTITLGNCIHLMTQMPPSCVDLIITDPPFAIDFKAQRANYNRTGNHVIEGYNEIHQTDYQTFTTAWLKAATRTLKNSGSMYIFSGWNHLKEILIAIDDCQLTTINHLIWKYQFGVTTKRKFVTSHYHCLYVCKDDSKRQFNAFARFNKNDKTTNGGSAHYKDKEDVWEIKREYWKNKRKTPTKLPAEIIRKMLAYSSRENDVVMDPFMGSGQVAVVSKMENRYFIGFEIVPEYRQFAIERIETGQYQIDAANTETPQNDNLTLWQIG